jgi:hypothetical protein
MIALFSTLITALGAAGGGSIFKMITSVVGRIGEAKRLQAKQDLVREVKEGDLNVQIQKQIFGNSKGGLYEHHTRRIVAVVSVTVLGAIGLLGTIFPDAPLLTLDASNGHINILWGLFSVPVQEDKVEAITTGHLAVAVVSILAAVIGFYGTPSAGERD